MSLHGRSLEPIPEITFRIVKAAFRKGAPAMLIRDELDLAYQDIDFAALFPEQAHGAEAPWRLALVTILQVMENLSDLQAAEMVRLRLDWKYALSLSLEDRCFEAAVLENFRQQLVEKQAQDLLLEPILQICYQRGLLKVRRGKQRLDAAMVLANVRRLSGLASVEETMRDLLKNLANLDPEWSYSVIGPDWFDRYVYRSELQRFPTGKQVQAALRQQVGEDGWHLLQAITHPDTPPVVRASPYVKRLQQIWKQHYEEKDGRISWRDDLSQ
jgi:transposase